MDAAFKRKVRDVLARQELYHLIPIYDSAHDVPQRIHAYAPDLFVVLNPKSQKFEIHSAEHDGYSPSIQCVLPYNDLDARAEKFIRQNDIRVRGKEIFYELDRERERRERSKERDQRNMMRDVIAETQSMFAKDAWTYGT